MSEKNEALRICFSPLFVLYITIAYGTFDFYYVHTKSQNTVLQLAKQVGSIELFELKDDLALTLQLCDQYTYNNAFVYFQPGNGKYSIKEPQQLARKAMKQLEEIIALSGE